MNPYDALEAPSVTNPSRPTFVIETDLQTDVDDVGAIAVAIGLHRLGEIDLAAVCVNTPSVWGPRAVDTLREHSGVKFQIGSFHGKADTVLAERNYASPLGMRHAERDYESSVTVLRRVLSDCAPDSVTIASIGFFGNLNALLASDPDDVSPLTGLELVRSRVARTVVMGGIFPLGREFNVAAFPSQTQQFLSTWPGALDLVGFETADAIFTGSQLETQLGRGNPFADAYRYYQCADRGRESWDPLTILLAARPHSRTAEWSTPGTFALSDQGENSWISSDGGSHRYAITTETPDRIASELDELIRIGAAHQDAQTTANQDCGDSK